MSAKKKCCCDTPAPCTTCCLRVTFTGVTLPAGEYPVFESDPPAYIKVTASEGTLNGVACTLCYDVVAGSSFGTNIKFAARWDRFLTADDSYISQEGCGYAIVFQSYDAGTGVLSITVTVGGFPIFHTDIALTVDQQAIYTGSGTTGCEGAYAFGTAGGDNDQLFGDEDEELTGSVSVTMVPVCESDPTFRGDCTITEDFTYTICEDDACPCGRLDAQPTCTQVTIKDASGVDSVYQSNAAISGTGDRNYVYAGPYERADGTWWRFLVVQDNPTAAAWNSDGAYFEKQCVGDSADNYSGSYAYSDAGDWTGTVATVLTAHQTALTNIGTTVTVADCSCDDTDDVYTLSVQCTVGTTPVGWTDITITRYAGSCVWFGTNGTFNATLIYSGGEWVAEVRRVSGDTLYVNTIPWAGSPLGAHGYDGAGEGLDEDCADLKVIIS